MATDTDQPQGKQTPNWSAHRDVIGLLVLAIGMTITLALMGRVWWCEAGDWWPWSWDVWSRHNSQHLMDPYSLSHIQHGIGLYLILTLLFRRQLSIEMRVLAVAMVEATWEVAENTRFMIERYREVTISLDYYGDSIVNSLGDFGFCLLGVLIARRLPWWASLSLFIVLELLSIWWIRDSLLLNILMLLYPLEAIRQWQMAT